MTYSARQHEAASRPRLLITAYHYDRAFSMESRLAWHRAAQASQDYDVTVLCARGEDSPAARRAASADRQPSGDRSVAVVQLPTTAIERLMLTSRVGFYAAYRAWHRRVLRRARALHAERPFALVHHVSFCGFREPGEAWRLGVPFVWGPLGGTPMFPTAFLSELDLPGRCRERFRNALNRRHLRGGGRIEAAWNQAATVLAANRRVARDLAAAFGCEPMVQLETGVELQDVAERLPRAAEAPLRILWPGRLRSWKALPLLLKALAALPPDARYELRVLGQGPCLQRWQRTARRLGVAPHVAWVGWPEYPEQLPHYEWADVVAFTSLRDTSGTGLLEALAAGAPIIGVDHQGCADIMTDACALRIAVTTPEQTIAGFRDAVSRLAADRALLARLSRGARARARDFTWEKQWEATRPIYAAAADPARTAPPDWYRQSTSSSIPPRRPVGSAALTGCGPALSPQNLGC